MFLNHTTLLTSPLVKKNVHALLCTLVGLDDVVTKVKFQVLQTLEQSQQCFLWAKGVWLFKVTNSTGLPTDLYDYLPEHKLTVYSAWQVY